MITQKPKNSVLIPTYQRLNLIAGALRSRELNLAIVVGRPGIAKSRAIKAAIPDACWIEGNATAFGIYTKLYECRDQTIVIDDVDSIYSDRAATRLLKSLCQTEPTKTVSWTSNATTGGAVPAEFATNSNVVIIANDWKAFTANAQAVVDRGHLLYFDPHPTEVHARVASWFWDREIYLWIGDRLSLFPELSMRQYVKAAELKKAGLNWKDHMLPDTPIKNKAFADIAGDPSFTSENDRVKAFCLTTGMSRATYFNLKRRLAKPGQAVRSTNHESMTAIASVDRWRQ